MPKPKQRKKNFVIKTRKVVNECICGKKVLLTTCVVFKEAQSALDVMKCPRVFLGFCKCGNIYRFITPRKK